MHANIRTLLQALGQGGHLGEHTQTCLLTLYHCAGQAVLLVRREHPAQPQQYVRGVHPLPGEQWWWTSPALACSHTRLE